MKTFQLLFFYSYLSNVIPSEINKKEFNNLYHFSLGLVHLNKKNKKYTVGIEYGFTPKQEYYHVIDFPSSSVENALIGNGGVGAYAEQFSFKLLLEIEIGTKKEDK